MSEAKKNELTASQRYLGSDPNSPDPNGIVNDQYLAYGYDPIGNRQTYKQGAAAGDPNMVYTTNDLNQYEQGRVADEPDMALLPQYDEDGNLTRLGAAGDLNCDGDVDFFDIDAWDEALEGQAAYEAAYPGCNWYQAIKNGFTVLYRSIFDLVRDFLHDEAVGGQEKILARYLKPDLVIVDDFGMRQLPKRSGEYLFEIIMRRYQVRSTIMTSNRPLAPAGPTSVPPDL